MKTFIKSILAAALFYAAVAAPLQAKNLNTSKLGIKGDGVTLVTDKLQKAIDRCAATGGGTLTVSPGTYLTGTLYLRSHVQLHIERGAVILGSTRIPEDYPVMAIITGDGIEDAGISGKGLIDGQAVHPDIVARHFHGGSEMQRPKALYFKDCKNISVKDISIQNAVSWTFHLFRCDGVQIDGISIHCLAVANNDGIDIDAKNVTISNCLIESEDDAICFKSDDPDFLPENITVTNCVLASNCNLIKFGTASWAGFRNISVSNCVLKPTSAALVWDWPTRYRKLAPGTLTGISGIAIESADGGTVENLTFSNISMEGVMAPIFISLNRRHGEGKGAIRHINISGIVAKTEGILPCIISGIPESRIEDVNIRDVSIVCDGGEDRMERRTPESPVAYPEIDMFGPYNPAGAFFVRHADNIRLENIRVEAVQTDHRPAIVADDVTDLCVKRLDAKNFDSASSLENIESKEVYLDGQLVPAYGSTL